jgi:preprotein translocase subunit Sss1
MKSYLKYIPDEELYRLLADVKAEVDKRSKVKPVKKEVEDTLMIKKYKDFCKAEAPDVLKMSQQPTHEEFVALINKHGTEKVKQVLRDMNNWKPLLSKRKNVIRTAETWLTTGKDADIKNHGVSM